VGRDQRAPGANARLPCRRPARGRGGVGTGPAVRDFRSLLSPGRDLGKQLPHSHRLLPDCFAHLPARGGPFFRSVLPAAW
ncbi:unnamed protein product, partial [Amoebophrya sp. A120]